MAAICDLLFTLTPDSICISRSMLLDPENVGVAIGISLIFVIVYVLLVMAAIFDFPGYSCIEELHSSNVLLDLKNGVICQTFSDITLKSRNLIYIRSVGRHFDFWGHGFEYCETWKIRMSVLVFPYRSVKAAWRNSYPSQRYRGTFVPPPLGNDVYGKSLSNGRLN